MGNWGPSREEPSGGFPSVRDAGMSRGWVSLCAGYDRDGGTSGDGIVERGLSFFFDRRGLSMFARRGMLEMSWDRTGGQTDDNKYRTKKKCSHFVLFSCRRCRR
jgi:hypothetical protein